MACSKSSIQLKLLVDNHKRKVLFAEAGKDFVDFIFTLLTLPIGAASKLITTGTMRGSVGRLYQSLDRMDAPYLQPGAGLLQLQPMASNQAGRDLLQQLLARFSLYTCPGRCVTMTMEASAECPQCRQPMAKEMAYVGPSSAAPAPKAAGGCVSVAKPPSSSAADESGGGYVKGLVTYMVTDGLEVTPITSSITLINRYSARKDVDLAEKFVAVGMDEGLALIEAALRSDTVLSHVFLDGPVPESLFRWSSSSPKVNPKFRSIFCSNESLRPVSVHGVIALFPKQNC